MDKSLPDATVAPATSRLKSNHGGSGGRLLRSSAQAGESAITLVAAGTNGPIARQTIQEPPRASSSRAPSHSTSSCAACGRVRLGGAGAGRGQPRPEIVAVTVTFSADLLAGLKVCFVGGKIGCGVGLRS